MKIHSFTTAPIETLGTRQLVLVLGALGTACGGPTAADSGYAPDVVVSPQRATLAPGDTFRLTATGPARKTDWTSLNGGVATVDSFGKVRALALGTALIVAAEGRQADTATVMVQPALRSVAVARHFVIGTAVEVGLYRGDAIYRQKLATQYNGVTPEWEMKFMQLHPSPTRYNFTDADAFVSLAQTDSMTIHGHTLVWYAALPNWITQGTFTRAQLLQVLKDHITTVVGRYRGKIATWDVANEVVGDEPQAPLRSTIWLQVIGPDYIDSAFAWAHRADPAAKLYLNDYQAEGVNPKSDAILSLVKGLRARGIQVDGVGFQAHFTLDSPPAASDLQANLARFANAGFDVRVSEMDVRIADSVSGSSSALTRQATIYNEMLDACLRVARCVGFTTWGFTDKVSWIPKFYPGYGRALPFDGSYQPKPAYTALLTRLQQP